MPSLMKCCCQCARAWKHSTLCRTVAAQLLYLFLWWLVTEFTTSVAALYREFVILTGWNLFFALRYIALIEEFLWLKLCLRFSILSLVKCFFNLRWVLLGSMIPALLFFYLSKKVRLLVFKCVLVFNHVVMLAWFAENWQDEDFV